MSVLLLLLAGPLQSWGDASRFSRRMTRREPTKSGIIGMLAAAQGRRRTDPIEDLLTIRFGVRVDQPGRLLRDFHTARSLDGNKTMPLSERYYITDSVFLAGVQGDDKLIASLAEAICAPHFPPYLGRRACVPAKPIFDSVHDVGLEQALIQAPWKASDWFKRQQRNRRYSCSLSLDREAASSMLASNYAIERIRDEPLSWDPRRRDYGWREVLHTTVEMDSAESSVTHHDAWKDV